MSSSDQVQPVGHERRDVRPGSVVVWTAGVFVLMLFAFAAMWLLLGGMNSYLTRTGPPANPMADYGPTEPPAPRLQADPLADLQALRAREQAQLDGYGWVDRQAGTVHIPLDRAMQLLLERRGQERR